MCKLRVQGLRLRGLREIQDREGDSSNNVWRRYSMGAIIQQDGFNDH